MKKSGENTITLPENLIVFCERPWNIPALGTAALVVLTIIWGFYILDTYDENEYFESSADLSISEFLFRDVAAPDVQRIYEAVAPAVVGIAGRGANATIVGPGAIVGPGGYVMTAYHLVANEPNIKVAVRVTGGTKFYSAEVVKSEPQHDLVLLKMLTNDRFVFFRMAETQNLQVGASVFGLGLTSGGVPVIKNGTVALINSQIGVGGANLTTLLATDAVYSWEQSGGPVVNARGELVGIGLAIEDGRGAIRGYAVPAHVIGAHFQDVFGFMMSGGQANAGTSPPGDGQTLTGAAPRPLALAGNGPIEPGPSGSAPWWAMARAQVNSGGGAVGMNVMGRPQALGPAVAAGAGRAAVDSEHLNILRIGGYPLSDAVALALLAVVVGIVGGMMTMGGGILQVAGLMTLFGYGIYLIRPVVYLTNLVVFGAASFRHWKSSSINWGQAKPVVPWAIIGAVAGYFTGNMVGDRVVALLIGVFALLVMLKGLHEIVTTDHSADLLVRNSVAQDVAQVSDEEDDELAILRADEKGSHSRKRRDLSGFGWMIALGLPVGFVSGVSGISGGVVGVPLQRLLAGVPLKNAMANVSIIVFWASLAGVIVAFTHGLNTGLIDWQSPVFMAAIMAPGAYVGGIIGVRLMTVLPLVVLKWFYIVTMAVVAFKMLS